MSVEIRAIVFQMANESHEVELTHDGQTKRFAAEGLSDYITALSAVRANLLPPAPAAFPIGLPLQAQFDPTISTQANTMVNGSSLYFRHAGLGWLGFVIPFDDLVALHRLLGAQIEEAKISRARPLNEVC